MNRKAFLTTASVASIGLGVLPNLAFSRPSGLKQYSFLTDRYSSYSTAFDRIAIRQQFENIVLQLEQSGIKIDLNSFVSFNVNCYGLYGKNQMSFNPTSQLILIEQKNDQLIETVCSTGLTKTFHTSLQEFETNLDCMELSHDFMESCLPYKSIKLKSEKIQTLEYQNSSGATVQIKHSRKLSGIIFKK